MSWTVVKVGGSLYDWPTLGERLRAWLAQLDAERVLIVPGGGPTADAIRTFDRVHGLGDEDAHWLAIQTLSLNARFLQKLLPGCECIANTQQAHSAHGRLFLLDAHPFFEADESGPDGLPHEWRVTSDSLAVRAAVLLQATDLILLKSVSWDGGDWTEAIRLRVVDGYFACALQQAAGALRTRIVNLREWFPG